MENPDHRRMMLLQKFEQDNLHGVAAVALHGQEFGFTREMAHSIRLAASAVSGLANAAHVARMNEAAERIEALLPRE